MSRRQPRSPRTYPPFPYPTLFRSPRAGTRVTDPARWSRLDPDVLAWQFASEPSPAFLRDLFELRLVVEPAAAAAAAARHTEDQARQMADALDAMATQDRKSTRLNSSH